MWQLEYLSVIISLYLIHLSVFQVLPTRVFMKRMAVDITNVIPLRRQGSLEDIVSALALWSSSLRWNKQRSG